MIQYLLKNHEGENGKDQRVILEGIRVNYFDMEKYQKYPMVILGTGVIKSTIRAFIRAFRKEYKGKYKRVHFFPYIKANVSYFMTIKRVKKFMDKNAEISTFNI